jgi:hypothetical protein
VGTKVERPVSTPSLPWETIHAQNLVKAAGVYERENNIPLLGIWHP